MNGDHSEFSKPVGTVTVLSRKTAYKLPKCIKPNLKTQRKL